MRFHCVCMLMHAECVYVCMRVCVHACVYVNVWGERAVFKVSINAQT